MKEKKINKKNAYFFSCLVCLVANNIFLLNLIFVSLLFNLFLLDVCVEEDFDDFGHFFFLIIF